MTFTLLCIGPPVVYDDCDPNQPQIVNDSQSGAIQSPNYPNMFNTLKVHGFKKEDEYAF